MICRLCGNTNLKIHYTQGNKGEFPFYKCPNCKLVNYDISCGMDQRKYGDLEHLHKNEQKILLSAEKTYSFIRKYLPFGGNFIDIGCGTGELLNCAHEDGWAVTGLELSPDLVEYVRNRYGVDVINANILDFSTDSTEKYDVVVLRHVIEHLEDPVSVMKTINSLLTPGGYSVMEFPNIESPELRLKRFLHKAGIHKKRYKENYKPGHCNEFCKESFTWLVNKTGFDLVVWETYAINKVADFFYNHFPVGNKARTIIKKRL